MPFNSTTPPSSDLGLVVVIPAKAEAHLILSLEALANCTLPDSDTEVFIIINDAATDQESIKAKNRDVYQVTKNWINENSTNRISFHVAYFPDLPPRHAGVGLARRIGMDEACNRLFQVGRPDGIITGFDADSRCDPNYLTAIATHFREHPDTQAASIYFEHPLEGDFYSLQTYEAITLYELHLRYYIQAQRYAGFPFAFHTVGSSMAVRANAYRQQGGMNRRKAGEDFYFLHKFTPLGHFTEIHNTRVIPSPRSSDRVPFGTGKAVQGILTADQPFLLTYAPQSFMDLKKWFDLIVARGPVLITNWEETQTQLPRSILDFLQTVDGRAHLQEILEHTASPDAFQNRFFRWFNAFQIMKYVHFARDHYYPDVPVEKAAYWLLNSLEQEVGIPSAPKGLLHKFRRLERGQ